MTSFVNEICEALGAQKKDPFGMNPLVLAYIGDSAFDLAVRTLAIQSHDAKAHALHMMCAARVRAGAQAIVARELLPSLTENERAVFLRARNAKPGTMPKSATPEDYSLATAFEAVLGYVFLSGDDARLLELINAAINVQGEVHYNKNSGFKPS